jgi:hypothetical protein
MGHPKFIGELGGAFTGRVVSHPSHKNQDVARVGHPVEASEDREVLRTAGEDAGATIEAARD